MGYVIRFVLVLLQLNDVPEFLRGDLKYKTHHIVITYKKPSNSTCQDTSEVLKCPHILEERTLTNATAQKSSVQSWVKSSAATGDMCNVDLDVLAVNEKPKKPYHWHEPLLTCNSLESEEGELETKPLSLHHSCSSLDDFKPKNNIKFTRLSVSANAAELKAAKRVIFDKNRLSTLHSSSQPNLWSASKERGIWSSFNGLQKRFRERKSSVSTKKSSHFLEDSSEELFSEDNLKFDEIHLYMLLDETVMLAYLRSTWDNCLLVSSIY